MTRGFALRCGQITDARVLQQPAHGWVTNVSGAGNLTFDVRPDADSPRRDQVVFLLTGPGGERQQSVAIEVIPLSENSPPVCEGDEVTTRSDGSGPATVLFHPFCYDDDGDGFVIEGGPPGTHLEAPKRISPGSGDSNWSYRTATYSGTERTKIWATDDLGARSQDATLTATIGPTDRLPECRPSTAFYPAPFPIYSRPGATRRFGLVCEDPDGDLFDAHLSSLPNRGTLLPLTVGLPQYGYWGVERWIDATYVPKDESLQPDLFGVTAFGVKGIGPEVPMKIVPIPSSQNGNGGCGWWSIGTITAVPGLLRILCRDDEGDPLTAEVVEGPTHGTITGETVLPTLYGEEQITMAYLPDPGFDGYDCMKVEIRDEHGFTMRISVDIWVSPPPVVVDPPPTPEPPTNPIDPPLPSPPSIDPSRPAVDPSGPSPTGIPYRPPVPAMLPADGTGAAKPRRVAQDALRTTAVHRVPSIAGTQVWLRDEIAREDLLRFQRAPAVVVVCSVRCQVRSGAALGTAVQRTRMRKQMSTQVSAPGQAQVLSLGIGRRQRIALRRGARMRGVFDLTIRTPGRPARTLTRAVPVSRR